MSLVNPWIEYKEREAAQGSRKKSIMDLLSFQEHVVEALCKAETNWKRPVDQPSFPVQFWTRKQNQQSCQTMNADMMISIIGHNPMI